MSEYCRIHSCNNCQQCMFDNQTKEIIEANENNARSIITAINDNSARNYKKRKSDLPAVIVQVLILGLLIFGYVSLAQ